MRNILIVDEDKKYREWLSKFLTSEGYNVIESSNASNALSILDKKEVNLILANLELNDMPGIMLLKRIREINPHISVIMTTANATVDQAVEAMKEGAFDFLQKPFKLEELKLKLDRIDSIKGLVNEVTYLRHERNVIYRFDDIVGKDKSIKRIIDTLRKVAPTNANILILGDTGTGKELIAGAVHYNSPRREKNFVRINCAALHENLLESELFGHEKGAFTGAYRLRIGRFEQADQGTMFLDEIGDMSLSTQAKVLRVIEGYGFERLGGSRTIEVDVRILAATNKDIVRMVENGNFREDLYYRINLVTISIPPLRERKEDIPLLANYLLKKCSSGIKKYVYEIDNGAMELIMEYDWPGNVRELENAIERAVILCSEGRITAEDLSLQGIRTVKKKAPSPLFDKDLDLDMIERDAILEALKKTNFVQKDAAKLLGISSRVINYKIKKHNIILPEN